MQKVAHVAISGRKPGARRTIWPKIRLVNLGARSTVIRFPTNRAIWQTSVVDLTFPGWSSVDDDASLQRKLSACERLTAAALKLSERDLPLRNNISDTSPLDDVPVMPRAVFEEFGKTVKTFRACVQLASTGYGPQSLLLAAAVLQSSLVVAWAAEQGESVDRRADLHARFGMQVDLEERRRLGLWKSLPSEEPLSESERREATSLFGDSPIGLWTGHDSMTELVDDIASAAEDEFARTKTQALKVMAARASCLIAGSGLGAKMHAVVTQLPDGQEAWVINIGPGAESCSDSLHMSSGGLLTALDTMVRKYVPELEDDVRRCEAFIWRAWKEPQELAELRDSDPCPCDRPGTFWGECHKWTGELGTVQYVPLTDADTVNFIPYTPNRDKPLDVSVFENAPEDIPAGPVILTFTFKLPFTLGLQDGGAHVLAVRDDWADPDDTGHFGKTPIVRIRLHNHPTDGMELWPPHAPDALRSFYGEELDNLPSSENFAPIPDSYEQWVTIETPSGRLASESSEDAAYAFHRGLNVLNTLLTALDLAETDRRISRVSTHEIGPVVFRGALTRDGKWVRLGDLVMHIDSYPFPLEPQSYDAMKRQIDGALESLQSGRPFILANLWYGRALRAFHLRGDNADCVASAQTAVESMMYDLLRGLLTDLGKTAREIDAKAKPDLPFKSLITKEIPPRLGGDWSLMGSSPVGKYWNSLYLLRNRVAHAGYSPSSVETESALEAFLNIREYISELLWRRNRLFPRTLLAKVGENGLVRRGWMSASMQERCAAFKAEPRPFYWPRDLAGW
jgi:hypothetical protein